MYVAIPHGIFATWIDNKLKEHQMTRRELGDIIGVTQATILNYYQRKTKPRQFVIEELSYIFNEDEDIIRSMIQKDWA